jgi:cytochrome P450
MRNSPTAVGQAYDVKRVTTSAGLRTIDELPLWEELAPMFEEPGENVDFDAVIPAAFERYPTGILRSPEIGVIAFHNRDLGRLGAHPDVANVPPEVIGSRMGHLTGPWASGFEEMFGNDIFTMNPPVHRPVRKQVARPILKGPVDELEPLADEIVESVLQAALEREEIDFYFDFAGLVCAMFWGRFLKMDPEVALHLKVLAEGALPALVVPAFRTDAEGEAANRASKEFMDLIAKEIDSAIAAGDLPEFAQIDEAFRAIPAQRCPWAERQTPADITVQEWLPDSVGGAFGSMVYDGYHTAGVFLTNIVRTLVQHPDVMQRLREDPELVPEAVYEAGRLNGAVISTARYTLADLEYQGVFIPKNTLVRMMWMAGNRDPEVFENPAEFRFGRQITEHTTFGGGGHICLGRHVGKLLAGAIFRALTRPGIEIELTGSAPWVRATGIRQTTATPVAIRRS